MTPTDPSGARLEPVDRASYLRLHDELGTEPVAEAAVALNITRTWAHSPGLMTAQAPLQHYLMFGSALSPRIREVATIRIGWRCSAPYEVHQHLRFGREAGLTDAELAALLREDAAGAVGFSDADRAAIRVADDLFAHQTLTEDTWALLCEQLEPAARLDLLSLVGRYWTVSVVTNALRVQPEAGGPPVVDGAPSQYGNLR
ncbi:carboxymuconolactone decarboxylase family protein [Pseudonocardia nematodicida]|uniref:Carboxymuconolactone decarboxylase family protein n=1 Tax=Pseudonocardia nematodicida TaxID=1206997 RepID=A0ABV1KEX0_9PSEU